jgi:hypothetical protein
VDVTFPEETDLTTTKLGDADMLKILPNRVQASFSGISLQGTSPELYVEWKLPSSPPETPFWTRVAYDPIFLMIVSLIVGSIIGRYPWFWIDEKREKRRIAGKLIKELEEGKESLKNYKPMSTVVYDSSFSKLLLLDDKTVKLVKRAYVDIKAQEGTSYSSLTPRPGESPFEHQRGELTRSINKAINALKKGLGR